MKKLRNGLIFLMILVMTAAWMPAMAEGQDFPFLPGLTWASSLADVEKAVGVSAADNDQSLGNSGRMVYLNPESFGLAPVRYEVGVTLSSNNALSMVIFLYDVGEGVEDKDAARGQIFDEMEKLYGSRGEVLYDSGESMQQAFANKANETDAMKATALGGLEGSLKDMYTDLSEINLVKGWLVDRKYAAMTACSTEGSKADRVAVVLVNLEETLSMMMDASLPEDRTGCFDLPKGAAWMCSAKELKTALSKNKIQNAETDGVYQAIQEGPAGSQMIVTYMFQDAKLMGAIYIVSDLDFDQLEIAMTQEFGNKTGINTEQIKEQVQMMMGIPATRASVWLGTDSLNYLFESEQGNFIMRISSEMLMAQ